MKGFVYDLVTYQYVHTPEEAVDEGKAFQENPKDWNDCFQNGDGCLRECFNPKYNTYWTHTHAECGMNEHLFARILTPDLWKHNLIVLGEKFNTLDTVTLRDVGRS